MNPNSTSAALFVCIICSYYEWAALGLCCCAWVFSSCSEPGSSLVAVCRLLIGGLFLLWSTGSRACRLQSLWCAALVVLQHVRSFWTRDQTHVPCLGRWILNHWATRAVKLFSFETERDMTDKVMNFPESFPEVLSLLKWSVLGEVAEGLVGDVRFGKICVIVAKFHSLLSVCFF